MADSEKSLGTDEFNEAEQRAFASMMDNDTPQEWLRRIGVEVDAFEATLEEYGFDEDGSDTRAAFGCGFQIAWMLRDILAGEGKEAPSTLELLFALADKDNPRG